MFINVVIGALLLVAPAHTDALMVQDAGGATKAAVSKNFRELSSAAERARNEGRDDDAIGLYSLALKSNPDWEQGQWFLSTLFYGKERYADARDLLRRFVAQSPGVGPGWALLGLCEFQTHEYSRALDHLQRAMKQGMGDRKEMAESVFYTVSALLNRFERFDDSMNLLMAMVKSGEDESTLIEPIGLAALRLPLLPTEIPSDRREMIRMAGQATLALEAQRQDEATRLFDKLVTTYPNEPVVHFLRGAFLMDLRPEEGILEMKRELEITPSSVPARLRLAEQYIRQQQNDLALSLAREAIKLEPDNPRVHMIEGEALSAKGEATAAINSLERARTLDPQTVRIRWDLLRAYSAAGKTEEAAREREAIQKLVKEQH